MQLINQSTPLWKTANIISTWRTVYTLFTYGSGRVALVKGGNIGSGRRLSSPLPPGDWIWDSDVLLPNYFAPLQIALHYSFLGMCKAYYCFVFILFASFSYEFVHARVGHILLHFFRLGLAHGFHWRHTSHASRKRLNPIQMAHELNGRW